MGRMTAAQFRASQKGEKSKYGAKRVKRHGITFDSIAEADRWDQLCALQSAGEISNLKRQVRIPLWGKNGPLKTDSGKRTRAYVADFTYVDWRIGGAKVVEDKKGFETPEFKLKRAILSAQGVEILIT